MSEDLKIMKALLSRLEAAVHRMEDVVHSRQDHTATLSNVADSLSSMSLSRSLSSKQVAGVTNTQQDNPGDIKLLSHFDDIISTHLAKYVSLSEQIGTSVYEQATLVRNCFTKERYNLSIAIESCKPSPDSPIYIEFLRPLQMLLVAVNEVKEKNRSSVLFNHLSAVADGTPALGWIAVEPAPSSFIGDMKDSAQFYANRVIKEYKEKDAKHVDWARSFIALLAELQKYVKSEHTKGLTWNPQGVELSVSLNGQPAMKSSVSTEVSITPQILSSAPPPPPGPPPVLTHLANNDTKESTRGDMKSVFAELNQGSAVTAGLKKVEKSQMTHKNPDLKKTALVPKFERTTPFSKSSAPSKQNSVKKPPRKELEGTKWIIENFEDDSRVTIDNIEIHHSVYIFNCRNSTIRISGKFNALSLDGCIKTGVVVDTLVSSIDLVKSNSFTVQVLNNCPTIICDVCDSGQIYLSTAASACEIVTSKCGSVNVNVDLGEGDYKEEAVPEMLKHKIIGGKLHSSIVVHAD